TITLNGSSEKIKAAEAVIQQYDTPRRQAEFVIRVIEAGSASKFAVKVPSAEKGGPLESNATDVVPAELKLLLRYDHCVQRDLAVLRGMESEELQLALGGNLGGYPELPCTRNAASSADRGARERSRPRHSRQKGPR